MLYKTRTTSKDLFSKQKLVVSIVSNNSMARVKTKVIKLNILSVSKVGVYQILTFILYVNGRQYFLQILHC